MSTESLSRPGKAEGLDRRAFGWLAASKWRARALPLVLAVVLALLTVVPLLMVVLASFRPLGLPFSLGWTLDHYIEIWSSSYTYGLVMRSLGFAAGSTVFGLALAGTLAWLLERTDLPWRNLFRAGILMPMATPPLLLAIGWVLLMSPRIGVIPLLPKLVDIYSLGGMIFIQGLAYVPTSILILAPVMRNMDPTFEEAALMSGAGFAQTLRRVSFPFLVPSLLSVATLLMIVGMLTFDVPAVIGLPANVNVMSSEIYNLMNPPAGLPEYGRSAALNGSLLVLLGIGLVIYYRAIRQSERFASVSGKGYKATRFKLGRWRPVAGGFVAVYFLLAVVLPFLALVWASLVPYYAGFQWELLDELSLRAYGALAGNERIWHSALNSVVVAATASVAVTVLSLVVAWAIVRSRERWVRLLDILSMIPISVPYLMMGVALIFVFFSIRVIPIYGTVWIIALGHLIIYLPLGSRMMQAAVLQLHRELEEAASVAGASLLTTFRRVVAPLVKPAIFALLIWVVVHSLREFSVAVMLASRRNEVLSTVLFSFWDRGHPELASAIAVSLMLVLGSLVAALTWLTRYGEEA